jgi:hypothetical protein
MYFDTKSYLKSISPQIGSLPFPINSNSWFPCFCICIYIVYPSLNHFGLAYNYF